MIVVGVIFPIVVSVLASTAKASKVIRAGKDIKDNDTAILSPRMPTREEFEEYQTTKNADRLRELDLIGTYRFAVFQAHNKETT